VLGILAGTLSIGTPSIVGAATPSFARWIFAVICYVGAVIQVLGFVGVAKENAVLFRRYTTLHALITVAAFSVAAVWIAISASRHSTAQSNCEQRFFSTASDITSEGQTMCAIFPWVDIGLMGGLWALLLISQFYFYTIISGYGTGQRGDHEKFNSIYSMTGLNSDFADRSDPWEARVDLAPGDRGQYGHSRVESTTSDTEMFENPFDEPSRQVAPAHLGRSHNQYDEYSDPYYSGQHV